MPIQTSNALFAGARLLAPSEAADVDLGPLQQLPGTWTSAPGDNTSPTSSISNGWNEMSIPGPMPDGFTFEVIPYHEEFIFEPMVIEAGNRGPFPAGATQPGANTTQQIFGLIYKQSVISDCNTDLCKALIFPAGTTIHAETGMFLFLSNENNGFNIARLATIPHGNSALLVGQSFTGAPDNNQFMLTPPTPSPLPTFPDGRPILDYGLDQFNTQQFPGIFDQLNPNLFLSQTLGNSTITAMTTLALSSSNSGGGVLNVPFLGKNVDAPRFDAIFWIETIEGQSALQLQYSQTIQLVFPPTGSTNPVIWPHITINTMTKMGQ